VRGFCHTLAPGDKPERSNTGTGRRKRKAARTNYQDKEKLMLEWLKTILGDAYSEEIEKQISAEIGKGFVARTDFNAANEAKKAVEAQLAEANKVIAGYKGMNIDEIRQSAADWQAKAEKAQKDADERVAAVQFDAKLDGAIGKRRGRSVKAIKAMLDVDALRGSEDLDKDIDTALAELQKDSGYLFEPAETPPPLAPGTGSAVIVHGHPAADGVETEFSRINPTLKF